MNKLGNANNNALVEQVTILYELLETDDSF